MTEPRTEAGRKFRDYLRNAFVHEADDTEPLDMTVRIMAIEAEATSSLDKDRLARAMNAVGPGTATWAEVHAIAVEYERTDR